MKLIASCRDRWVRRLAMQGVTALVVAGALGACPAPSTAAAAPAGAVPTAPRQATQDLTFAALGLGDQTVHGPTGSILIYFPAPQGPLAASGNFVRVFFGHSAPDDPAAKLAVAVNGEALATVPLSPGTRAGGVFEKEIPAALLHADRPNRLEVHFSLLPPGRPAASAGDLHGQLGSRTVLHYELRALDGGPADALEDYPASLLGSSAALGRPASLALVLPARPDTTEVTALARLMADLGRRTRGAHVAPQVLAEDPVRWLASAPYPALMVGRLDQLPAAGALLQRAGFTRMAEGWLAPQTASPIRQQDAGIVAVTEAPDVGGQPVLLVTGGSDRAVARAAGAVIRGPETHLRGRYAVIEKDPGDSGNLAPGADRLKLSALLGDDPGPQESGEHRLVFSLPARAADPGAQAELRLEFDSGSAVGDVPPVVVEVNGRTLEVTRAPPGSRSNASAYVSVPGSFLHAGLNQAVVVLRLAGGPSPTLTPAESSFQPAPPPRGNVGLAGLPYPFLDGEPGVSTTLILASLDGATLQALADAFVALGSRAISTPPPTAVRFLLGAQTTAETSERLVVVGSPQPSPRLGLHMDAAGDLVIVPPVSGPGLGWVMREGPLLGGLHLLWVGGDDSQAVARAALALGGSTLGGNFLVVGADGRASSSTTGSSVTMTRSAFETWLPRLLPIAATLLLLLVVLGTQAFSTGLRGRGSWRSSPGAVLVVLGWCFLAAATDMMLASRTSAALFVPGVLVVGALSLRVPRWQGVVAAVLAAAALESIETFLSGSRVLVTLNGDAAQAARLTAMAGLADIERTLVGMVLLLATPAVAALAQGRRQPATRPGHTRVVPRKGWS